MYCSADGLSHIFVLTLAVFVGDVVEAKTAFGILHHAVLHSDISTLFHRPHPNDQSMSLDYRERVKWSQYKLAFTIDS